MPNFASGAFCGKDHAFYKYVITSITCPFESKGCKFVAKECKDPIGAMHQHLGGEKPHKSIGMYYCFSCGKNFEGRIELGNHCMAGHPKPKFNIEGTFYMVDGKAQQPLNKKIENEPYNCCVCGISNAKQSEITLHFLKHHRKGVFSCPFPECVKKKVVFDQMYNASVHFNDYHSLKKLLKDCAVKRRC